MLIVRSQVPLRQPEDGLYRLKHVVVHYIVTKYTSCDTVVFDYTQFSKCKHSHCALSQNALLEFLEFFGLCIVAEGTASSTNSSRLVCLTVNTLLTAPQIFSSKYPAGSSPYSASYP